MYVSLLLIEYKIRQNIYTMSKVSLSLWVWWTLKENFKDTDIMPSDYNHTNCALHTQVYIVLYFCCDS